MRAIIKLTETEKRELKRRKTKETNAKIYRRYLYVEMSNREMTNLEIADYLGVCNDTLTDWKRIFDEAGLEGLSQLHYEGRRESQLKPYEEEIKAKVQNRKVSSLKQLQSILLEEYNLKMEQSWLSRYAKKNLIYPTKKQD